MHIYNWYHSNVSDVLYVHEHRLQYTWCIPLAFCLPLLIPLCSPFYLLGTLLAVAGSVHLGLRLLVNWPPLSQPFPQTLPPSKFPEPQSPSASLRRPQEQSGVFCPEHYLPFSSFFAKMIMNITIKPSKKGLQFLRKLLLFSWKGTWTQMQTWKWT